MSKALVCYIILVCFGNTVAQLVTYPAIPSEPSISVPLSVLNSTHNDSIVFDSNGTLAILQPQHKIFHTQYQEYLSLPSAIDLFLKHNPEIQKARYEWFEAQEMHKAAWGEFEPRLVGRHKREENGQVGTFFSEYTEEYRLAIEGKAPTGTQYDVGLTQTIYENSTYRSNIFLGAKVTQPLLKNFLFFAPVLNIKSAALQKKQSFQLYRQKLGELINEVENKYWELYFTQKKMEFAQASVQVAKDLYEDAQKRFGQGRDSKLDYQRALAELSRRMSAQIEAQHEYRNSKRELTVLLNKPGLFNTSLVVIEPNLTLSSNQFENTDLMMDSILNINPIILSSNYALQKQKMAVSAQKSSALPKVDIFGTWGVAASSEDGKMLVDRFQNDEFRDKVLGAGIEIEIPIFTGVTERSKYKAEVWKQKRAQLDLTSRIRNIYETRLVQEDQLLNLFYKTHHLKHLVSFHSMELQSELDRVRMGKSTYQRVYEVEEALRKAQSQEIHSFIEYQKALSSLYLNEGSLLIHRGLEWYLEGEFWLHKDLR
jgi:outer membrane protein TolC